MVTFGILISYILGIMVVTQDERWKTEKIPGFYWRFVFTFPIYVSIFQVTILTFVFKDETPYYLMKIGKHRKALEVLNKIVDSNSIDYLFASDE